MFWPIKIMKPPLQNHLSIKIAIYCRKLSFSIKFKLLTVKATK